MSKTKNTEKKGSATQIELGFQSDFEVDTPAGMNTPQDADFETTMFSAPTKFEPETIGESAQGIFKGVHTISYVEEGEDKSFLQGILQGADSQLIALQGHELTVKKLPMLPEGITVRVVYKGEIKIKNQPSPMKTYEILTLKQDKVKIDRFRKDLTGKGNDLPF